MLNNTEESKLGSSIGISTGKDAEKAGCRTEETPTEGAGAKVCNLLSGTDGPGTLDKPPWDPGQITLGPGTNHPGTLDKSLPLAGHHFPISKQGNGTGFSGAFIGWPRMP